MYGSRYRNLAPSPVWASTAELWESWAATRLPWPLVHGHSLSYNWWKHDWFDFAPRPELRQHATLLEPQRHVRFNPPAGDHPIFSIDQGLSPRTAKTALHALVVTTADGTR